MHPLQHAAVSLLLIGLPALPSPRSQGQLERATYAYDPAGRLIEISYEGGATLSYEWDENGNLLRREVLGSGLLHQDDFESGTLGAWSFVKP